MYREQSTGDILSADDLRKKYPNKSLPAYFNENVMADLGVDFIETPDKPEASAQYKILVKDGVEQNESGAWQWIWVEQDQFPATEDKTTAELISEHEAQQSAFLAQAIREDRNKALADTDWMGASDLTMSAEWAAYRQALRDIPQQSGFPENAVWPEEP